MTGAGATIIMRSAWVFCCDTENFGGEDVRGRPRGGIFLSLGCARVVESCVDVDCE